MGSTRLVAAVAAAALASPFIATSASAAPPLGTAVATVGDSRYAEGRDIAEALLFATGRYAAVVTALPTLRDAARHTERHAAPEAQRVIEEALDALVEGDPQVFARLRDDVRSGDPYRVEGALVGLSEATRDVIETTGGSRSAAPALDEVPPNAAAVLIAAVAVVSVGGAVVAATVGSVVNAVHAANALWTVNWAFSLDDGERATQAVAEVTTAFGD